MRDWRTRRLSTPRTTRNAIPGVFHRVGFDNFPAGIPKVYVVLRVAAGPNDYGNHKLHVHYQDANGRQIGDAFEKIFLFTPERSKLQIIVPYVKLLIPQPGAYSFEVSINGQQVKSVQLQTFLGPPPPQTVTGGIVPKAEAIGSDTHERPLDSGIALGDGPWLVALSVDDNISVAGPLVLTLTPPRTDREIGLLVNSELEYYKDRHAPAPGVEIRQHLVMKGGAESQRIESLKLGDANKRRVVFRGLPYDITLMSAKASPPKPGNAYDDFACEILVSRAE